MSFKDLNKHIPPDRLMKISKMSMCDEEEAQDISELELPSFPSLNSSPCEEPSLLQSSSSTDNENCLDIQRLRKEVQNLRACLKERENELEEFTKINVKQKIAQAESADRIRHLESIQSKLKGDLWKKEKYVWELNALMEYLKSDNLTNKTHLEITKEQLAKAVEVNAKQTQMMQKLEDDVKTLEVTLYNVTKENLNLHKLFLEQKEKEKLKKIEISGVKLGICNKNIEFETSTKSPKESGDIGPDAALQCKQFNGSSRDICQHKKLVLQMEEQVNNFQAENDSFTKQIEITSEDLRVQENCSSVKEDSNIQN